MLSDGGVASIAVAVDEVALDVLLSLPSVAPESAGNSPHSIGKRPRRFV